MTKDHSMIAAGHALADMSAMFHTLKGTLPETGVQLGDFREFVINNGVATAEALRMLVQAYHEKRLLTPSSTHGGCYVRTDLSPPLPGEHSHQVERPYGPKLLPINRQMEAKPSDSRTQVELVSMDGTLYVGDWKASLYRSSLLETDVTVFNAEDTLKAMTQDIAYKLLSAHVLFALLSRPHLIPEKWKKPTDGYQEAPYIVFAGTRWHYDQFNGYQCLHWDGNKWGRAFLSEKKSIYDSRLPSCAWANSRAEVLFVTNG